MSKIKTYTNASQVSNTFKLIGTDVDSNNETKNLPISVLSAFLGLTAAGGYSYITVSSDHTITTEDMVFVDATATITLPDMSSRAALGVVVPLIVKNIGVGVVTLSEEIEGVINLNPGESVTLVTDLNNWYLI